LGCKQKNNKQHSLTAVLTYRTNR